MDLLEELQTRVVCGDGAMGTMLLGQGISLERCFEELCVSDPDRITDIHEQYIEAGARVIKTNTFGANAARLRRFNMEGRVAEINHAAADLAGKAARSYDVAVAGSVGPLGLTAGEAKVKGIDRGECFREQIEALVDGGVELIFLETFTDFEEVELALAAKNEVGDVPTICSFACAPDGHLSCGMTLVEAFQKLRAGGVEVVGANCVNGPGEVLRLLECIPSEYLLAAYPNAGNPTRHQGDSSNLISPEVSAAATRAMIVQGARLIGGCCGTTPIHIKAIASAISDLQYASDRTNEFACSFVS